VAAAFPHVQAGVDACGVSELAPQVGAEMTQAGIAEPIVDRLVTRLVGRARLCLKLEARARELTGSAREADQLI